MARKCQPVLNEDKTVSGTGSVVASYFAFYCYLIRLGFISILAFILLPGTQRIFSTRRLSLFLLLFYCVHVCYRKKSRSCRRNDPCGKPCIQVKMFQSTLFIYFLFSIVKIRF